jgi:hypothetical protein
VTSSKDNPVIAAKENAQSLPASAADKPADAITESSAQSVLHTPPGPTARAEQQVVLKKTDPAKASVTMAEDGRLPKVAIPKTDNLSTTTDSSPDRPDLKREKVVASDKQLTPEEKYFTNLYQNRFLDARVLAAITPTPQPKPGESEKDAASDRQQILAERTKAIRAEMGQRDAQPKQWLRAPEFGPATQAAYADYIGWIGKKEVPSQLLALQSTGQSVPAGNPVEVPIENGQRINLYDYLNRIASGKLVADLGVDPIKPPVTETAQRIENALDWTNQARDAVEQAALKRYDSETTETINRLGFPKGWLYQPGQDRDTWRAAVGQMIDLTTSVGRLANMVDKLKLPIDLPPGARVTTGGNGTNISLDLPQDLRLFDPVNAERVRALKQWQTEVTPKIAAARQALAAVAENPNRAIAWGDTTIPKVKDADGHEIPAMVSLDKNGKLLGIVDPTNLLLDKNGKLLGLVDSTKPRPVGERFEPANMLVQRFTATTDPQSGEIVVRQNVQAQDVPWWSYQNLIHTDIGKPADLRDAISTDPGKTGQIDNNGNHVSTKDNQITLDKDIVLPDGRRIPTGSKFGVGTIFDGDAFKSADQSAKVVATTPDGTTIEVARAGTSMTLPFEKRFKPDDLVAVKKGTGTEIMLAKDLDSFERTQRLFHDGEKVLTATMDVAMLATGTVELSVALKGARVLAGGTEVLSSVLGKDILKAGTKGIFDTSLALGGLSGNSEIQSSTWGRQFAADRNLVFTGAIFYGAVATKIPALKFAWQKITESASQTLSESDAVGLALTPKPACPAEIAVTKPTPDAVATPRPQLTSVEVAEPVCHPDGTVRGTADSTGTLRQSEDTCAQGQSEIKKVTIGDGSTCGNDGPGATGQLTRQIAEKMMMLASYPIIANQIADIGSQTKELIGLQLQSMGYQLPQMWRPTNPYLAACAVQDYDRQKARSGQPDAASSEPQLPLNPNRQPDSPEKTAETIREYKQLMAGGVTMTPAEKTNRDQVNAVFDKLAQVLSSKSEPAQEALKKELAANITFQPGQLEELETVNSDPLSSQQLADLIDPEKRAHYPNQLVRDMAAEDFSARDPSLEAASEMALLYLSQQTDKTAPASLATAEIDVRSHYAGYGDFGPRLLIRRTVTVDIPPALIASDLHHNLEVMGGDGRGIAIGDLLVKNGTITPQEYGGVLQNIVLNPNATAANKIRALSDATGPRMAALIGGLLIEEQKTRTEQALTDAQQATKAAILFGATASDFEKTLSKSASDDPYEDVRTMSAAMLYGLKRFASDPVEGAKLLDRLSSLRQKDIDKKEGDFTQDAANFLLTELTSSQPNAVQQRLDAAEAYALLATKSSPPDAERKRVISRSLGEALKYADLEQSDRIAKFVLPDGMKQFSQDDAQLAEDMRKEFISKIQTVTTFNQSTEDQLASLLGKMPALLDGATSDTRSAFYGTAKKLLRDAPPVCSDLRSAIIPAMVGDQAAIPTLERLAVSDQYPSVRLSALKTLEQMQDCGLNELVADRIGKRSTGEAATGIQSTTEGDATVLSFLRDLQYRLDDNKNTSVASQGASSELMKFQSSINQRYASLQNFDVNQQKLWLQQTFPLLVRENFDEQVCTASEDARDLLGQPTAEGGKATTAQRQGQFEKLAELAEGNSEQAAKARQVLYSIITTNGGTIGAAEKIPTGTYVPYTLYGNKYGTKVAFFDEESRDWTTDAAKALAKTTNVGFAGRDLTASLVSMALASGVKGQTRDELLKAWDNLAGSSDGVRPIPEALYQYVKELGSDSK